MHPLTTALPFRKLSGRRTSNSFAEKAAEIHPNVMWSPWILAAVRPPEYNNDHINNMTEVQNGSSTSNGHANGYGNGKAMSEEQQYQSAAFVDWSWATEFHGMGSLLSARSWKGKAFWILVILSCLIVGVYSTYALIAEYTASPTATLITLEQVKELPFPKITICPKFPDAVRLDKVVASMRASALPPLDNATATNLIAFAIAGSGFNNLETLVYSWSPAEISMYSRLYDLWRGNASVHQFFTEAIEANDFRCEDLFPSNGCLINGRQLNCCAIFEPRYVMRRGRCFSSIILMQTSVDEIGKMVLKINQMPSRLVDGEGLQPETVIYLSDYELPIPDYPRYYINPNVYNRMRFRFRLINQILKAGNNCTIGDEDNKHDDSPNSCFVNNWLNETVIKPLNCSLPYLLDYSKNKSICHPEQIVRNYEAAIHQRSAFENVNQCKPLCVRWEFQISIHTSRTAKQFKGHGFSLEASYMDLVFENFKEVRTTTFPGFVSQIGGQLSLFLGISIITFVQFILHAVLGCYRYLKFKHHQRTTNNLLY